MGAWGLWRFGLNGAATREGGMKFQYAAGCSRSANISFEMHTVHCPSSARWRGRQDGKELRQLGHVFGFLPAILTGGPHKAVTRQAAISGHAAQLGFGKGACCFAVPKARHLPPHVAQSACPDRPPDPPGWLPPHHHHGQGLRQLETAYIR